MKGFYSWYSWLFVWVLLFFPKISIIGLSGYAQGIRLEDLLTLVYVLILLAQFGIGLKVRFKVLWIITGWLLLVGLFSSLRGYVVEGVVVIRLLEYIVLAYALWFCAQDRVRITKWFRWLIYLNAIVALLQYMGVVGAFASFAYLPAGHSWLSRPYGLLGGPWELGVVVAIAMLAIIELDVNKMRSSLLLQFCVLLCLVLADTRANLIAYLLAMSVVYYNRFFKTTGGVFISVVAICFAIALIVPFLPDLFSARMNAVLDLFKGVMAGDVHFSSIISALARADQSFMIRVQWWDMFIPIWKENFLSVLFGAGWIGGLYMESFLVRVLVSFGLIGAFLFLVLARRLSLAVFLFVLISGFTLDLFVSSKIFTVFCLYVFLLKGHSGFMKPRDKRRVSVRGIMGAPIPKIA